MYFPEKCSFCLGKINRRKLARNIVALNISNVDEDTAKFYFKMVNLLNIKRTKLRFRVPPPVHRQLKLFTANKQNKLEDDTKLLWKVRRE